MKNKIHNWSVGLVLAGVVFGLATAAEEARRTPAAPPAPSEQTFTAAHRFVFYAVLEGCFEEGIDTPDVDQMLRKDDQGRYAHFIYGCPLCTPTIQALEAYRSRPAHFYGLKSGASTFGCGLSADLKRLLYSGQPEQRLVAINALVQRWIARRQALLRFTPPEQTQLQQTLQAMRKQGMQCLQSWKTSEPAKFKMSAFAAVNECAVCNAACGMALQSRRGRE